MERQVHPGEFYRSDTNKLYQILAAAVHAESGERMVVYQALQEDYQVYVLPYESFVAEREPGSPSKTEGRYRFERVSPEKSAEDSKAEAGSSPQKEDKAPQQEPNPALLDFLDTEDYGKRMGCLKRLAQTGTQADLDSLYVALDLKPLDGDIETRISYIAQYLSIQRRYDGEHLRQRVR